MHAVDTMNGLALPMNDIGTGKTTPARKLPERLDEKDYGPALLVIFHSAVTPEWLLRKIALQMGAKEIPEGKVELPGVLFQRLLEIHESGRQAVVPGEVPPGRAVPGGKAGQKVQLSREELAALDFLSETEE